MVIYWLSKSAQMIILLLAMTLLLLVPARHVLAPLWPWPVEELIIAEPTSDDARREFVVAQPGDRNLPPLVSQDRPIMLVTIETVDGEFIHGFLVGARPEPDAELMEAVPSWLFDHHLSLPQPANVVLVVMRADESRTELPLGDIHRLYRPNQLSLLERILLTGQRMVETWRMPGWELSKRVDSEGGHLVDMIGPAGHHQ